MHRTLIPMVLISLVSSLALAQETKQPSSAPAAPAAKAAPAEHPAPAPTAPTPAPAEKPAEKVEMLEDDLDARMEIFRRGPVTLNVGGVVQVQAGIHVGDEAQLEQHDAMDTEGFRVRRARLGFGGNFLRHWKYYIAADFKEAIVGGNEILDAKIIWTRFSMARVSVGLDKVPFSRFAMNSSSRLTVAERPLIVQKIAPDRRVGITILGDVGDLEYAAGYYNGSSGVTQGNKLGGMAVAASLQYHVFGKPQEFVPGPLRLAVGGGFMFNRDAGIAKLRAAGHLDLRLYRVQLLGEFLFEAGTPEEEPLGDSTQGDYTRLGAAGELSVFIWRKYVQVALRYEMVKDNVDVATFGDEQLFTGGVNCYLFEHKLKLMLSYTHRNETDGQSIDNDIALAHLQAMF